jgi:hypothetical protein
MRRDAGTRALSGMACSIGLSQCFFMERFFMKKASATAEA